MLRAPGRGLPLSPGAAAQGVCTLKLGFLGILGSGQLWALWGAVANPGPKRLALPLWSANVTPLEHVPMLVLRTSLAAAAR